MSVLARSSSAHIGAVTVGAFVHNDRLVELSYAIDIKDNNEVDVSADVAYQNFIILKIKTIELFVKRTGQQPQQNTEYLKEIIVNLEKHHTLKDLNAISNFLEKEGIDVMIKSKNKPIYDIKTKKKKWTFNYEKKNIKIKILQKSIHRDEGFIEEDGLSGEAERHYNYHAHIDFFAIDLETGLSIKFKSADYEKLQDIASESLGMKRGKRKSKGEGKNKRLDTFEFKKHKERESETVQQAQNRILYEVSEALGLKTPTLFEMKAHISKLRSDLISANKKIPQDGEVIFSKEDYTVVSKLKNSLKASNVKFLYQEYLVMKQGFEDRIEVEKNKSKTAKQEEEKEREKKEEALEEVKKLKTKMISNTLNKQTNENYTWEELSERYRKEIILELANNKELTAGMKLSDTQIASHKAIIDTKIKIITDLENQIKVAAELVASQELKITELEKKEPIIKETINEIPVEKIIEKEVINKVKSKLDEIQERITELESKTILGMAEQNEIDNLRVKRQRLKNGEAKEKNTQNTQQEPIRPK